MELIKIKTPELDVIEQSRAEMIKKTFEPMAEMLSGFEDAYSELMSIPIDKMTRELTAKYKRLRLDIGKVRIETGKLKDKQKEYIKLEDRAIMGVHNILVWAVKEKEDKLKEREDYFEIQEQKRLAFLQSERVEKLSLYVEDAHERALSGMDEDVWNAYLSTKKKEYEDRIAAEKKSEEDRIAKQKAEIAEQKRIAAENENLKEEVAERDRLAKIEGEKRAKEEAERKIREEKERKEREEFEVKLKAEREAKEKIEREERAKREKLEAELRAKEEAERKAKEEEASRLQAELNKGDVAKVKDLITDLKALKTKYSFKSAKNKKMYSDVNLLLDKVINYI